MLRRRLLHLSLLSSLLLLSCDLAAETRAYEIPRLPLNEALLRLASQAQIQIIFPSDLVRDRQSKPLKGNYSFEQALSALIADETIQFRSLDQQTVTLYRQETPTLESQTTLDTVWIYGKAINNDSTPAKNRYYPTHIHTSTASPTSIKSLPQSVHSVSRAILEDQQSVNLSDSLNNVSGVIPRNPMFTPVTEGTLIRGFRAEQLLDGFTQYYNPGDREGWINIERIDVLKGSNMLIYGGGSGSMPGGVINLTSKKPQDHAFTTAGFKVGSYDFYQPYLDINRPINPNLWFRLTGEYTQSTSFIDVIETQRYNINPSITLTNRSDTELTIQGKLSRWQQPEYQGLPTTGTLIGSFRIPSNTFVGPADIPDSRSQNQAIWGSFNHQLNDVWSISLKARYAHSQQMENTQSLVGQNFSLVGDHPFSQPSTWLLANAALRERQNELSFNGHAKAEFDIDSNPQTLLIGADHSQLDDIGYLNFNLAGQVDMANPQFTTPYAPPGSVAGNQVSRSHVYGVYLQWQSDIAQRAHTLLGLRAAGLDIHYMNPALNRQFDTQQWRWLPRLGLSVDLTNALSTFVSYSQGMRGQPFVVFANQPQPELSQQLEAGIKFDWNGQLSGQFAVYQIDRNQIPVAATALSTAYNPTGQQRAQGYEADIQWQPFPELSVSANYANCRAQYVANQLNVARGNHLPGVPDHSGRLWANYRFQQPFLDGIALGFGVYASSGSYIANNNAFKTPSYHSFDSSLSYEIAQWKLAASIKNLSNEQYFIPFGYLASGAEGGGRLSPAMGTQYYVNISVNF